MDCWCQASDLACQVWRSTECGYEICCYEVAYLEKASQGEEMLQWGFHRNKRPHFALLIYECIAFETSQVFAMLVATALNP